MAKFCLTCVVEFAIHLILNESGRLRFLSQKIAFHSTRLVYEKHQDGKMFFCDFGRVKPTLRGRKTYS